MTALPMPWIERKKAAASDQVVHGRPTVCIGPVHLPGVQEWPSPAKDAKTIESHGNSLKDGLWAG